MDTAVANGFAGAATTSVRRPPLAVTDLSVILYDGGGGGGGGRRERGMKPEPSPESVRTIGLAWDVGGTGVNADSKAEVAVDAAAAVAIDGHRELSLKQLHVRSRQRFLTM